MNDPIQNMPVLAVWDIVIVTAVVGCISIVWLVAEWWTVSAAIGG